MKYFGLLLISTSVVVVAAAVVAPTKQPNAATKTSAAPVTTSAPKKTSESSRQSRCYSNQFECSSGECVNKVLLCNGHQDCRDGSDESFSICFTPAGRTTTTERNFGEIGDRGEFSCGSGEFLCTSGECISQAKICDGQRNCRDGSDEAISICPANGNECRANEFRCNNGQCIPAAYKCDGNKHCSDGSDEDWAHCQTAAEQKPSRGTTIRPAATQRPNQAGNAAGNWGQRLTPCTVPPQPSNGRWRLHRSLCDNGIECNAPLNVRTMDPGSYLVYSCDQGFILNGTSDVLCGPGGKWIHTPKCDEIRCPVLSSSETEALCTYNNVAVSCEIPAPAGTTAQLKCRQGFVQEVMYEQVFKDVQCQRDGHWSPKPIRCVKKPRKVKLVLEGDMILGD